MSDNTGLSKREKFLLIKEFRDELASGELSAVEALAELYEHGFSQEEAHDFLESAIHTEEDQNGFDFQQDNATNQAPSFAEFILKPIWGDAWRKKLETHFVRYSLLWIVVGIAIAFTQGLNIPTLVFVTGGFIILAMTDYFFNLR